MIPIQRKRRRSKRGHQDELPWDSPEDGIPQAGRGIHQSKPSSIWILGVLLAGGLLLIAVLWCIGRPSPMPQVAKIEVIPETGGQAPLDPEAKSEAVIAELLSFVNAPNHHDRSMRVYEQANILEYLKKYYNQGEHDFPKRIINPSVSAVNLRDRELLLVAFTDQNGRAWSAPFEWKRGAYRLHWEAMVGFGAISWKEFFGSKPTGHFTMRAKFFLPENETPSPVDPEYVMILMSHPELPQPVSVRVRYGSEAHQQLVSYPRSTDIPGIVEIYWPEGSSSQPVLSRWLQRDWIE
jgi:hypothetical protein